MRDAMTPVYSQIRHADQTPFMIEARIGNFRHHPLHFRRLRSLASRMPAGKRVAAAAFAAATRRAANRSTQHSSMVHSRHAVLGRFSKDAITTPPITISNIANDKPKGRANM